MRQSLSFDQNAVGSFKYFSFITARLAAFIGECETNCAHALFPGESKMDSDKRVCKNAGIP